MRGYVPTPEVVIDRMVTRLFEVRPPSKGARLLDPGCGNGEFIDGVIRWCSRTASAVPQIVGVELHPGRAEQNRSRFANDESVRIVQDDFLTVDLEPFDFVIGNPPYVGITELNETEKARYRSVFKTAKGRFDLYLLFWERALQFLKPSGRLVFITPEKYLTVETARPLRAIMARLAVPEIELLPENTFPGLTTYPAVTTLDKAAPTASTRLVTRDGVVRSLRFGETGDSLAPSIFADGPLISSKTVLEDLCIRISCGVATGADKTFVRPSKDLHTRLRDYAYPTISGRQLSQDPEEIAPVDSMLVPYDAEGHLRPFDSLDGLGTYLEEHKDALLMRTCVSRKPWYAFHESPPLLDILRPKILCKDLTNDPHFWIDWDGGIVPRHSVYYIVPHDEALLAPLAGYLNSAETKSWLRAHCQRAANGFIRLQSSALKKLPVLLSALDPHARRRSASQVSSRHASIEAGAQ